MFKLNKIVYKMNNPNLILNLVALGFSNNRIIIIDLDLLKIHQELKTPKIVYSLSQFKAYSNYLICSLSNGQLIIYKLKNNKYKRI